jgi:hypothetical protein
MYRVASIVEKLYVDQWGASLIARVPDLEAL